MSSIERCPWAGIQDPEYARYHDEEWGVPKTGDRELFEKLVLEGFQAGLSWLTILRKRANFRAAFDGFEPERIAAYSNEDIERLMNNPGIVRNRSKIEATISNARAYLELSTSKSFASFLWDFVERSPVINMRTAFADIPPQTELSKRISKALKAEGFRFVGPTTVYAFMQSVGMVNDHLVSCHRHGPCSDLQRAMSASTANSEK